MMAIFVTLFLWGLLLLFCSFGLLVPLVQLFQLIHKHAVFTREFWLIVSESFLFHYILYCVYFHHLLNVQKIGLEAARKSLVTLSACGKYYN